MKRTKQSELELNLKNRVSPHKVKEKKFKIPFIVSTSLYILVVIVILCYLIDNLDVLYDVLILKDLNKK